MFLSGLVGNKIAASVRIIPEKKYPFKILSTKAKRGENINYKLRTESKHETEEYLLRIENLKKEKGRYHDIIYLKTDSSLQPEIKIIIVGNIINNKDKSNK